MAKTIKDTPEKKDPKSNRVNIASTLVLAFIAITFIGAPAISSVLSLGAVSFGSYAGKSIDYTNSNFFGNQVSEISRSQQTETTSMAQTQSIWRQAFEAAALRTAIEVEAEASGVLISTPIIDNAVRNYPTYVVDGQFSPERFRETPEAERSENRRDISTSLLQSEWIQTQVYGPELSDTVVSFIQNMAYPQRKFDYVVFTDEDYPDSEAETFGKANPNLFQSMVLSRITITTSAQDAAQVLSEIQKGDRTFENLAKTYSKDSYAQQGGSMGRLRYYELRGDFENGTELEQLFGLQQSAVSPVYKTPLGWSIYRVQEPSQSADFTQPETVQVVKQYLLKNERELVDDYLKLRATEFQTQAEAGSLQVAARPLGKTPQTTGFFAINFGNNELLPSVVTAGTQDLGGLSNSEEFYRATFSLKPGEVSTPIVGDRRILVFTLNEEKTGPDADAVPPEFMLQQYKNYLIGKRLQAYQDGVFRSYKFKDNFEEGFKTLFSQRQQ